MQEPVNNSRSELWTLSLRDLFYKYVRFLPVILLSVAFCLFVAYAYLRYAPRIYSASGTLLIKSEQQGAGRSDKFEDIFMNNKASNIASEVEILKSRPLMQRVVNKLNLQISYIARGKLITNNVYKQGPFLLEIISLADSSRSFTMSIKFMNDQEFRVNNETTDFKYGQHFRNSFGDFRLIPTMAAGGKDYSVSWRPAPIVAAELAKGMVVNPKTLGTGILTLTTQSNNPLMCADIVNQLMQEYINYSIEIKNQTSEQILDFIDGRLVVFGHQLDSIQKILLDFQQNNNLIDIESQTNSYFIKISEADKGLNEQQLLLNVTDMIDEYLRQPSKKHEQIVTPTSLGIQDPTLNGFVEEYNKLQLERKGLIDAKIPEGNPSVIAADSAIERLRQSVLENLKVLKTSFVSSMNDFKKKSAAIEADIRQLPTKTKEFLEIKRKVETVQNLYKMLQEKQIETSISKASTIPNSQIIDKAAMSTVPIKPNRRAIQILAILLGLGLPAMFIFISEVLNDKIATRFDIEKITPAPILGEIGHSYATNVLIVTKTTRSMVAEQFRIIRSNLQYILTKIDKSVIVVTSSFSGEGKSFVATNLGAVLALAGKKTVILEFDIRKPKILSGLNMPKQPGITNFLVGKAKLEDLITPVPGQENLFVLACGPIPPNPSELLLDERVDIMFKYLKENFDVVLADTAPVGMVSDAQTLSKYADCTLYLVRQGYTFKKQVALIDEFYQENKLPKVSIVINDVKVKPGYGYYGYGRYGYGYGYGYGGYYEEEKPPVSFMERFLGALDIRKLFGRRKR